MKQNESGRKITAIIVDDEGLARKGLQMRLHRYPQIEVVGTCKNGKEALGAIIDKEPDLMFLDIQMPGMSGFEVIEQIQADAMPLIIFVTAYDSFAVKAFEEQAVDYLLKPVEEDRLARAIDKASTQLAGEQSAGDKQRLLEIVIGLTGKSSIAIEDMLQNEDEQNPYSDRLAIKDGSSTTFVPVKDIDWVDAAGDYMCVHVAGITHIMRTTMKELETLLDPNIFQRVHRSTIVNLQRVEKVSSHINGEFYLTLNCGASLKMSRSYKDKVKHFF